MTSLFGFFSMANNYDQRAVARHEGDGLLVDTYRVSDSAHDYETAVSHPAYNDGDWVIVEVYNNEQAARLGHDKWVKVMTATKLPDRLFDVSSAAIKGLAGALGADYSEGYTRKGAQQCGNG